MRTTLFAAALGSLLLLGLPTFTFAQELAAEPSIIGAGETAVTTTEETVPVPSGTAEVEEPRGTETASQEEQPQDRAGESSPMESMGETSLMGPTSTIVTTTVPITEGTTTTTAESPSLPEISTTPLGEAPTSTAATSSLLCLAIIAPAPSEGPEWVAVYGLTPSTSASFLEWSFADAQGSLVTVHASTTLIWDEATQTMRYELRSARLNNGGDSVFLKTPTGTVHDLFTYPETERGHRWVRDGCLSPWEAWPRPIVMTTQEGSAPQEEAPVMEERPTIINGALPALDTAIVPVIESPASEMSVPAPRAETLPHVFLTPPPAQVRERVPMPTPSPVKTLTNTANAPTKAAPNAAATKMASNTKSVAKTTKKPAATPKKTTAAKKPAAKKAAAPKPTPPIPSILMPPLLETPEEYQGIRVRLRGRVASQTNFLGAHTFVIVNEDGRGLLVKGTSKHPSPAFGTWIDLTGTVVWNDSGLSIKQAAADQWEPWLMGSASSSDAFPTRTVDLLAPSQEEAWSLVRVEGKISAVQKTSFDLDVGDASVRVRLVSRLGYRAQRLQTGDTVAVQGLLDLRGEAPTIVPQALEGIGIIARAIPPAPTPKSPVEQPWMPVGAAAGTLALSEGWRRFHAYRKQRREAASFRKLLEASGKDSA